jgi:Zn-dependent metalloprotease
MHTTQKFSQIVIAILVILTVILSGLNPPLVSAQEGDGIKRHVNAGSGRVSFIGPESGRVLSASRALGTFIRPQDPAMALAQRFAPEFGVENPERDLSELRTSRPGDGRVSVRYQQNYQGIPVMGGELLVNTNESGDLYSMNGEVSPDLSLSTQPKIDSEQARKTVLQSLAKWYQKTPADFVATEPELWIYDESLLRLSTRPAELVWRMEVTPVDGSLPVRELVLVDAHRGGISLHFNQVDTAWRAPINPLYQSLLRRTARSAAPSIVKYEDLIVDEARNRLYGADKVGNKIDVINMTDLSIISSYVLAYGAAPASVDLSPDGNELAVAQSGLGFVKFINLTDDTMSETPSALTGTGSRATDVIYGRAGVLYALSGNGLHVIDLTLTPHEEDPAQYVAAEDYPYFEKFGDISTDKNTLYFVTGTCYSGYNSLNKYDVSAGLPKPALLKLTHMYETGYLDGIRLNLIDDESLLITTGFVYNTSNLTPKANNFQRLFPAIKLPGRNFYATLYNNEDVLTDLLYFYDNESSYRLSSLDTGVIGTPGAITATSDGNTIFVSSTGGMAKFTVGDTPPGTAIALPASEHQYNDLAIDISRNRVYGTDTSGRVDVIDMDTADILNSYLLPSGADPIGIDLSPDGGELAVALHGLEKILFIDPANGATIAEVTPQLNDSIYYTNRPFDLIYGRTGRLYSSGSSGIDYIHVIDTSTHTWVTKSPYPNTIRTNTEFILNQSKTYLYANQTLSPNNLYIYDVRSDVITKLYEGAHGRVSAEKFTIIPDGSKIFTSTGQVWDSILQSQLGTLEGAPGKLIKFIPDQNIIIVCAGSVNGDILKFISPTDYRLIATYMPSPSGIINEMETAPDGSKLIINISNEIRVINLDPSLAASVSILTGSNQSTPTQTQFSLPLKVKVQNYLGQPISGEIVTFTAPTSGASGTFANTLTNISTVITDTNGIATSALFSANSISGSYEVVATVSGLAYSANFQLFNGTQEVKTYTADNIDSFPGIFLCDQTQPNCTNNNDPHADAAHKYAISTYNLYDTKYQRNSIDNNNMPIISSVHYGWNYINAFWNGAQMVYGDGYGFPLADDVVAHELTHGVTQYESNLFYYYQSGAINESFSDLWGEYFDQTNSQGNDAAEVKWLIGEDVSGLGAMRSMSNPPAYGDPDKMSSANYYEGGNDNGGVHTNSGVNNKAVYLMVNGETFNGKTVTALGWDKTAAIYYEANTNLLTSGADYSDLYYALQLACSNLVGHKGITAADCLEVKDALDAVEMNGQPAPNFNIDAPLCPTTGAGPNIIFADDLEGGTSNWTFTNGAYSRWQYDSSYGQYAQSGAHFLYADDYPATITDAEAQLVSFVVPANGFLHFAHAYDFESYLPSPGPFYFDGGVLEYSTNGGVSWVDASSLINVNGYKGRIFNGSGNPLSSRFAFVGTSHGYISTRVNLASLAGKTVTFRWRMGLDDTGSAWGWWLDNVKVYNCISTATISGNAGTAGVTLSYVDGTLKTATSQTNGSYSFQVPLGWSGTLTPSHACFTFAPANRTYSGVTTNQTAQNFTPTFNPASGCANVDVIIGGTNRGNYGVTSGGQQRVEYALDCGPVEVVSTNSVPIIAALRDSWKDSTTSTWTSFVQMMGLPKESLSDTYYFPSYNNISLSGQLRFGNVDTVGTWVRVVIGDVERGRYFLDPNEQARVEYDLDSGPVVIESETAGVKIIAALRDSWYDGVRWTSFSQMMGLPKESLSDSYYFPSYNNISLSGQLRFGNVDTVGTWVRVVIGGVERGRYFLDPSEQMRVEYALDSGPVVIESETAGVKIIAALRDAWYDGACWTSFAQMMGLTALSDTYYFPSYNNVSLSGQLRLGVP